MSKNYVLIPVLALGYAGYLQCVQTFDISGIASTNCVPLMKASQISQSAIKNPLVIEYTTGDASSYICRTTLQGGSNKHNSKVVALSYGDRFGVKKVNDKNETITKTPKDYGFNDTFTFFYVSQFDSGAKAYCFVAPGSDTNLSAFLNNIKVLRNAVSDDEKKDLRSKPPVSVNNIPGVNKVQSL